MFIINEQKKNTRMGGKGLCRVFKLQNMVDGTIRCVDITEAIAIKIYGDYVLKHFDGINLTVHYGSGTGQMVISDQLRKTYGTDIIIQDISIF